MNVILKLKRPFVWLRRFRYRCGYGVHSPFAFNFITYVIYEDAAYYAYEGLLLKEKIMSHEKGKDWARESTKMNRLLFRLVNWAQPQTIVDVGTPSSSALYLQAAKVDANYIASSDLSELFLEKEVPVDFLYLRQSNNSAFIEKVFDVCASRVHAHSMFVVEGIGYSRRMKTVWRRMQSDERTGISFDLYDFGIIFFDKKKIKQHYLINF
jgi:hypothetical protein